MSIPIISDIINSVGGLVSEAIVDKDKRDEINFELKKLEDRASERLNEQMIAQAEINKAEAEHESTFVAGWRPAVGWVCAAGLGAQVILFPILDRIFGVGVDFDTELLILTMTGMLGIGGMRSFDKWAGTDTKRTTSNGGHVAWSPELGASPLKEKKREGPTNILPENAPWM